MSSLDDHFTNNLCLAQLEISLNINKKSINQSFRITDTDRRTPKSMTL